MQREEQFGEKPAGQPGKRPDSTVAFTEEARDAEELRGTLTQTPGSTPSGAAADPHATTEDFHDGPTRAMPRPDAVPRRIGDYDVEHELGRGGMGVVYKARHRQLGRVVALKMIRAGSLAHEQERARFRLESRAVARLQHPDIVQIFDIGEHEGLPYFALEYVNGPSLQQRLSRQPLTVDESARIVERLARAMQYAHEQGILHRDIKPANILLTTNGDPKISDFGLAKRTDEVDSHATQTGAVLGTPSYMSPEQARGQVRQLTEATDQYSLGAVLYCLLVGRPPFLAAAWQETVRLVAETEPVPPRRLRPDVPRDLETICLKATQKEPARRYASCLELAEDLRRFTAGEPIHARPVRRAERLWRWTRRNPRVAIPSAMSVLLLLTVFVGAIVTSFSLSSLNSDLRRQTAAAKTQRNKAKQSARQAIAARDLADRRADVSLNTIRVVFTKVLGAMGKSNASQPLRQEILATVGGLLTELKTDMSADFRGSSGVSAAATTLAYEVLQYQYHREVGETEEAWKHLDAAHRIARQRIKDLRGSTAARVNLASICRDMANLRQEFRRDMQASLDYSREAADLYQDILDHPRSAPADPPLLQVRLWLSEADSAIAAAYVRLGDPARALDYFLRTQATRDEILNDEEYLKLPEAVRQSNAESFEQESATSYLAIGDMNFRLDHPDKAREFYAKALEIRRKTQQRYPNNPVAVKMLAGVSSQAGYLYFVLGEPDQAVPLYEKALELADALVAADPQNVEYRLLQALALYRRGVLEKSLANPRANEYFQKCREVRSELAKDAANLGRQREFMLVRAQCDPPAEAAAFVQSLLAATKPPDVELLLDVARATAQIATNPANDAATAEGYLSQALTFIQQAADNGHKDPTYLASEPDFAPLRDRPDFQRILAEERAAVIANTPKATGSRQP